MHKLQYKWILWEHQNTNLNYEQNTSKLGEFETIESFWNYYNSYPQPSKLFYDGSIKPKLINPTREISSISLFRENIFPKWEDPSNTNGGDLAIRKFNNIDELDTLWEEISVLCIGGELGDFVNGIRVVDSSIPGKKSLYRIEVWFDNKEKRTELETSLKTKLNIANKELFYKEHSTAVESTPKRRYKPKKSFNNGFGRERRYW